MNRRLLALACLLTIIVTSSHLERRLDEPSLQRRTQRLGEAGGAMVVLASMLHLNELARGFLWIQFFGDSTNILANYHRLLPLLDAITWLDPSDVDTWGLKTRMRLTRAVREDDAALREKAIRVGALDVHVDRDHLQSACRVFCLHVVHPGKRLSARDAPRRPEVNVQHFAARLR